MVKSVDATWIANQDPESLLVLDARPVEQYNAGYILGSVHICCSGVILRRLRNGSLKIESLLNCQEDKKKYECAKTSEHIRIVICDQASQTCDHLPSDSIASLLLKKVARDCKFVALLSGGYEHFQSVYPDQCEIPTSVNDCLLQKRPSSLVLQLSNISLSVKSSPVPGDQSSDEDESPADSKDVAPFEILPHLFLGCRKVASCLPGLRDNNITRILNVTSSVPNQFEGLSGFMYEQIAVEDSHDVDMREHLPEAFRFIEEARLCGEKVLVHCHAGMSRSVTVILAYLMKYYEYTLDSAYDYVKQRKSNISPNFSFMGQLLEYECSLRTSPADSGFGSSRTSPVEGHCFIPPSVTPCVTNRSCVLAA